MTIDFDLLSAAIERNNVHAVISCLRGTTEGERKAVSAKVLKLGKDNWDFQGTRAAAAIAVLGTAGGVRQVGQVLSTVSVGPWVKEAAEVLGERKPSWLAALPAVLLTRDYLQHWRLVREMVREGLVPTPEVPEYTTLMPGVLGREHVRGDIEQQLLADPGLLQDEVFRLFRVEGAARALYWADLRLGQPQVFGDGGMQNLPPTPELTWSATLARLARSGHIDFDRILDNCLAAFLRDFKPSQLGWYVTFHDDLSPTIGEMAPRQAAYMRLLAADASVGVGLGQKALEILLRSGQLDLNELVNASGPALHRSEKGTVLRQLRLLLAVFKANRDLGASIPDVLEPALTHERSEIREAARRLADRLPSRSGAPALRPPPRRDRQVAFDTGPVIQQAMRLSKTSPWAESIGVVRAAVEERRLPPAVSVPITEGRPLPPPISDPEELVVVLTRLIEDARDPIQLERALAGAARTAGLPIARRRQMAEALGKRAREQMLGWPSGLIGADVRAMIACVAFTWSTGVPVRLATPKLGPFEGERTSVDAKGRLVTPTGVFAARVWEVIPALAQSRSLELLAEPTHSTGSVRTSDLAERAKRAYGGPFRPALPYDAQLASLRLSPRERDLVSTVPHPARRAIVKQLDQIPDEISIKVVSGRPAADKWRRDLDPVVLGATPPLGDDGSILRALTDLAYSAASYTSLSNELEFTPGYGASILTWPLIAPWHPELMVAHLLRPLNRGLRPGKHDLASSAVSCLVDSFAPLGTVGHVALALGCNGAEGDTRTVAGDVVIQASRDGRLQPSLMSQALVELARAGVLQPKRVEATLRPLISEPAAAVRIGQTLEIAIPVLLDVGVKDMHVLLRLAAELVPLESGLRKNDRIQALAESKWGSEVAAAARAVRSGRDAGDGLALAGAVEILEGLLARATGA